MKVTHWGEDYAEVRIGTKTYEVALGVAKALDRFIKRENKKKTPCQNTD